MRIKSTLFSLATPLVVGLLSIATPAIAGTVTFGSYAGTTNPAGFANGSIAYGPAATNDAGSGSGTVIAANTAYYPVVIDNSIFVTYDFGVPGGSNPDGTTAYTTSYSATNLAGDSGSISVVADDSLSIFLNGNFIGTAAGVDSWETVQTFAINAGDYTSGTNTFTFDLTNGGGGPTAFDFEATAVSPAATPEPSSLILLGTGILGLAGAARRRLLA